MPGRVTVHAPDGRFAPIVETTLYFVCSEALTNVARHARATSTTVDLAAAGGRLRLVVTDDGIGGADPEGGSGLRGLKDRVEALGGRLLLEPREGGGTRLTAELPIDVSDTPPPVSAAPKVAPPGVGVGVR